MKKMKKTNTLNTSDDVNYIIEDDNLKYQANIEFFSKDSAMIVCFSNTDLNTILGTLVSRGVDDNFDLITTYGRDNFIINLYKKEENKRYE